MQLDNTQHKFTSCQQRMMVKQVLLFCAQLCIMVIVSSCADEPEQANVYSYEIPAQKDDGWQTGSIYDYSFDTAMLIELMDDIYAGEYDLMQSILIVKEGKLVFEEYMNDGAPFWPHRMQSVSKSFTSALTGLAIDKGFINSVEDPIFDYLPEYAHLLDADKERIRIKHLLTMTAGFEWNEMTAVGYTAECDCYVEDSQDYVGYTLAKPIVTPPGSNWYYNSGLPQILGRLIYNTTGMYADEFADSVLFQPLGIKHYDWLYQVDGFPSMAGGLKLLSRDAAKFGLLFLQNGVWEGKQVIPASWITESIRQQVVDENTSWGPIHYGYMWWLELDRWFDVSGLELYFASGNGGQLIIVIPALDAVVVTTADPYTNRLLEVYDLVQTRILPALASVS